MTDGDVRRCVLAEVVPEQEDVVEGAGRPVCAEEPLVEDELAVWHEHECVLFDLELNTRSDRTPGAVG
jgi:hypothetical protein